MTVAEDQLDAPDAVDPQQSSLATAAARQLATTTKSAPQMQGISPRWLLRTLPWVEIDSGTYRVNRRLTHVVGDGRIEFVQTGGTCQVIPDELGELAPLRGFTDPAVLTALAGRFQQREIAAGEVIAEAGHPIGHVVLVAHGKIHKLGTGPYGDPATLDTLGDGDQLGAALLHERGARWEHTYRTATPCVVLTLARSAWEEFLTAVPALREHVAASTAAPPPAGNKYGEAPVDIAAGHAGEAVLPSTYVAYDAAPREYPLTVAQTTLRVHTRVADLFSKPMDQTAHQLRLTVEELQERQEHDLLNHSDFGLLHNVAYAQRIQTRSGPPTPDDLDELLSRRRSTAFYLAHPKAIAAFRRQCTARGIYPQDVEVAGQWHTGWRGVPMLPSNKIPITAEGTSSILAMRTGEESSGVVGLRPTALPDEHAPGVNVRFTGIDELAVMSYLVSAYYSAAVLVPDALGVLENVELGR